MQVQSRTNLTSKAQLIAFTQALFLPNDQVEIRAIETWADAGRKKSRLVGRLWLHAAEIPEYFDHLRGWNEKGANVFFGVNPRKEAQGTKSSVTECRSLWCDWDAVESAEVLNRAKSLGLPPPSIVVQSGHGVHGYWLLHEAFSVGRKADRDLFEGRLREFSRTLGGDATHDVSRLLRLPGFLNMKNARNGAPAVPCKLLSCDPDARFSLSVSERWSIAEPKSIEGIIQTSGIHPSNTTARIRGLIKYLERDVPDRSRRDFGVVVGLLRLGVTPDEIPSLVQGRSKFAEDEGGSDYLNRTIERALRLVLRSG